jgi:UDP-N-acetylglucosamine 1-carboxyvinyltransferase
MDKLIIEGQTPLHGQISISGSKNAALPIIMSCLLIPDKVRLHDVPCLKDVFTTLELLRLLGCKTHMEDNTVFVEAGETLQPEAPYNLVRTMRASILCLGPLLARLGKAKVALPGGCAIGNRPVDLHLRALKKMGATIELDSGYIMAHCRVLKGAHISFDFPTVGGTENLLMAAVFAEGETILENAAKEPEIQDLAKFLIRCGAHIEGHGTSLIRVQGVTHLSGQDYKILPDRIEAGTYMAAAAITQGDLELINCPLDCMESLVDKFQEMDVCIQRTTNKALVSSDSSMHGIEIVTQPYPGFPTDMQAQIMALMTVAKGSGMIQETIFENRFMHALELMRLGADIKILGDTAFIRGVPNLKGAPLMASDLRASASLVLAGLAAKGKTEIHRIYHLDRGYERMDNKLIRVGAKIKRRKIS